MSMCGYVRNNKKCIESIIRKTVTASGNKKLKINCVGKRPFTFALPLSTSKSVAAIK